MLVLKPFFSFFKWSEWVFFFFFFKLVTRGGGGTVTWRRPLAVRPTRDDEAPNPIFALM